MSDLRAALTERCDGYWELLATAAGSPDSVERTTKALAGEELDKGFQNPVGLIGERVEALAAWNPAVLCDISKTWTSPSDDKSLWWLNAWRTSLRHLKAFGAIRKEQIDVPELADEIDVLWGELPVKSVSWASALVFVKQQPVFDSGLIRKLSRLPFVGPMPLLPDLLEGPACMLTLLRGKVSGLSADVQHFLLSAGQSCLDGELRKMPLVTREWTVGSDGKATLVSDPSSPTYRPLGKISFGGNLTDGPPILELCREISSTVRTSLGVRLAERLSQISDPQAVAQSAYILISDWRLP
jgi:hypothetical protein